MYTQEMEKNQCGRKNTRKNKIILKASATQVLMTLNIELKDTLSRVSYQVLSSKIKAKNQLSPYREKGGNLEQQNPINIQEVNFA